MNAQVLKGRVADTEGNAVPNATLYIREAAQGIMVDDRGEFSTTLKRGAYTCEFSSLGFEKKVIPVEVDAPEVRLDVVLEKKVYSLKEVVVSANQEDPAYAIMRRAIAMAPYYLHQVKNYHSEIYTKGTFKVEKLPKLFKISANNQKIDQVVGKLFLMESQSEVAFTAPDHYEENMLAFSTTLPFEIEAGNPMDVMTENIYAPDGLGEISPLSPGAFSYYRFALEGISSDGEHLINKIRVQPKKKNAKLVTGWLYIIENSWNVYSADVSTTMYGVTMRYTANCKEVKPTAFLPVTYDIDVDIDLMGVKAFGKYYASVQYKDVSLNEGTRIVAAADNRIQVAPEKAETPKQQKARQQLEALNEKENLSNRDAYKMSKLLREVVEPDEVKKERESLEIKPSDSNVKLTVDSLAKTRDSLYWAGVRNLPLRTEELESYRLADSLKIKADSTGSHIDISASSGSFGKYLFGRRIALGKKNWLRYGGLLGIVPEYNFVDGVWLGQRLSWGIDFNKAKSFVLSPSAYYVTGREAVNWEVEGKYTYAPLRNGELTVGGGNTTSDFNARNGTMRFINSLASLFFAENPVKFYRKKFVEAQNEVDLANGLNLTARFAYEKRSPLDNALSYSFFGGKPDSNLPAGQTLRMPSHTATAAALGLEYTPRRYYRIESGRKRYDHSDFPTFSLYYQKGFSTGGASASYDRLEGAIAQTVRLNAFDRLNYQINAGKFLSSDRLYFPDFKHFSTSDLFLTGNFLTHSFTLVDNYTYSTDRQWLQAHLTYTSPYLLIKNLPFLQGYLFDESLHARTLWILHRNYTEFGYSAGLSFAAQVGVFVGLDRGRYDAIGVTVSLPILKALGLR